MKSRRVETAFQEKKLLKKKVPALSRCFGVFKSGSRNVSMTGTVSGLPPQRPYGKKVVVAIGRARKSFDCGWAKARKKKGEEKG